MARSWYAFFFLQIFRFGYQLDGTAEMYLATVTTEGERTGALMKLTMPQAAAMFFGPILGSKIAAFTSLRISQFVCGCFVLVALMPVLTFMLPTTHSIPRLASAKLRPQDYFHMIRQNVHLREGLIELLLRAYMKDTNDSAYVLLVMAAALLAVQFIFLPILQRKSQPKTLLQQLLVITAVQTGCYAVAYAETSTQITSAVERTDLGKATGLASMCQWLTHFILPIYASHLVQHYHYTYAFYTSAVITTGTLSYVTFVVRNANNRVQTLLPSLAY
ncbi:unnamed protein product, partial [Mesorhabditis spiculigera]